MKQLLDFAIEAKTNQQASATAIHIIQGDSVILDWAEGTGIGESGSIPISGHSRFNVYSIRKAYIGIATALSILEGKLPDIDAPVRTYLDNRFSNQVSKELTIRHLVTHTHGLDSSDGSLVQTFTPGTNWMYNNAGVELLCKLLETSACRTVSQIIEDKIVTPLGLNETGWKTEYSPDLVSDIHVPGETGFLQLGDSSGSDRNLFVSPRDLAQFAGLHLKRGIIRGKQLLPAEVFDMVTSCWSPLNTNVDIPRHGFFWWLNSPNSRRTEVGREVPDGSYQIIGMNGSICLVIPQLDAVVVRMVNKIGGAKGYNRHAEYHRWGDLVSKCLA